MIKACRKRMILLGCWVANRTPHPTAYRLPLH